MISFFEMIPNFGLSILSVLVGLIAYGVYRIVTDPLRKVPGPWLARFTRLWELQSVRGNHFEQVNIDLHHKYGPVVRLAPNKYSIDYPTALSTIYGHGSKLSKDPWYMAYGNPDPLRASLFTEIDVSRHAVNRRKVASLFSMTTLVEYEPSVDKCIMTLNGKLAEFVESGENFESTWMQYFAFDVIGEITVGEPFGMMRTGGDVEGILQTIDEASTYASRISLFIELHSWISLAANVLGQKTAIDNLFAYVSRHLAARRAAQVSRPDFIQKLLKLQDNGKIDDLQVFGTILVNIAAGSDTTGATLAAVIYNLARYPQCMQKLYEEIDTRASEGKLSDPVTFAEAQQMPYLQAVIKEALRIHPAIGLPLPRVVPPEGMELAGYFFPGGVQTVVGINAWVSHQDKSVFGADADLFRPERWLGSKEEVAPLERNLFSFGAGSRTCIGKNISLLEMTKVVPQMYRRFGFQLENAEWETKNILFVKPRFKCKVFLREATSERKH